MISKVKKKILRPFYKSIFYALFLIVILFYFLDLSARFIFENNEQKKIKTPEISIMELLDSGGDELILANSKSSCMDFDIKNSANKNSYDNSGNREENSFNKKNEFINSEEIITFKNNRFNKNSSLKISKWNELSKTNLSNKDTSATSLSIKNKNVDTTNLINNKNNDVEKPDSENEKYSIKWKRVKNSEMYEIVIEAVNTSNILNNKYVQVVNQNLLDTLFTIDDKTLLNYENYRWKYRSKIENTWSDFSEYNYFNIPKEVLKDSVNKAYDDLILRFKYGNYIDEMIIAKYNEGNIFLPLTEILNLLQLNHNEDINNSRISVQSLDNEKSNNSIDFVNLNKMIKGAETKISYSDFTQTELEYYVKTNLFELLISAKFEINLRNLEIKFSSDNQLPMAERFTNQRILQNKSSINEEKYPLKFDRERKYFSGGFFDYSLYGSYVKNVSPYYSINLGLGNEILGGDFQINSSNSIFKNEFMNNQTEYRWRYAFLNNRKISSITLGNEYAYGLQSYSFRGISITNQPLELRKNFGFQKLTEKTFPFANVEIYHNNEIIDILQADADGNFNFNYPFSYGTTILEFKYYGTNGETKTERKLYQIPTNQIPVGEFDYSLNFGKLISTDGYLIQANSSYGINDRITTQLGTDLFVNDFKNSSIFSKTSARVFEGYIANLNIAPNAFYEFEVNSIFADLANFNIGAKFYEKNDKINPTNIKSEIDGNIFIPIQLDENYLSIFARARKINFNGINRYDYSLRTFYDINNFSPSVEYNYAKIANTGFISSYLNLRMNYSFYIPYEFLGGNIIESRLTYNFNLKRFENFNISLSSTLFRDLRVQIAHNINFATKFSDTQLRIVLDLPFLRTNTNISNSVFSQSILGSVNYNSIFDEFDFHNRGMVGRSAAAIRFFLDENNNDIYDTNEKLITDIDVSINAIANKKYLDNGRILLNDLESYYKFDLKLNEGRNKNPVWVPVLDKFSFISDPNQFKEISIPFYEASVVNGIVYKIVANEKIPLEGINVFAENLITSKVTKIKTLSDGSFYLYGISSGKFKFYLDETQLEKLKLKSYPEKLNLNVHSINSDENNEDIIFILK